MLQRERYIPLFKDIPGERQQMPECPVEEGITDFRELELGFTKEQAVLEASRCLGCRKCVGCGFCAAICHAEAIDFTDTDKEIEIEVDSIVLAPGVERISSRVDEKFGYGKYVNVINFLEFERILSSAGPYGGLILRPYDGETPKKIAFVQCPKERDNSLLFNYAAKEALYAGEKVKGLEAHLFFPNIGVNELERYFDENSKVSLRKGEVVKVTEKQSNKNLVLRFNEDGKENEEEFEMVILLTWLELPSHMKELNEKLGLSLKGEPFWEAEDISPKKTSKSGVFFAGSVFAP